MTSLPLTLAPPPAVLPWLCGCGTVDSDGAHAPGSVVGSDAVYRYESGPWECSACSRASGGAYLELRRERMALVRVSRWLGYPARTADVERFRRAGEQQVFGWAQ